MQRVLIVLAAVILVPLAGLVLFSYLSFGLGQSDQDEVSIRQLNAPVSITFQEEQTPYIEAQSEADAYSALGYLHGRMDPWSMLLWRQVAIGQTSAWFGSATLDMDRFVHTLALADQAQRAYTHLSDSERVILEAYTQGLSTALMERDIALNEHLVLLEIEPQPWLPWHSLALERLLAWLATPPFSPAQIDTTNTAVAEFIDLDERLRTWLNLHGFEHSTAWAVRTPRSTSFQFRHVYGATALPLFMSVALEWDNHTRLALSIPGTPILPVVQFDSQIHTLLLSSERTLSRKQVNGVADWPPVQFSRPRSWDGTEVLIEAYRSSDELYFSDHEIKPYPDTTMVWTLHWAGFSDQSDWPVWRAFAQDPVSSGAQPIFTLFSGDGLIVDRSNAWTILGNPTVQHTLDNGILISNSSWGYHAGETLQRLASSPNLNEHDLSSWHQDVASTWAMQLLPLMVQPLRPQVQADPSLSAALSYLQNWDFRYHEANIGASIFEAWVSAYQLQTGSLPTVDILTPDTSAVALPDSIQMAAIDTTLLLTSLQTALTNLSRDHGASPSGWRWELVQANARYFPVWSDSSLHGVLPNLYQTRYAPLQVPGSGHPSTIGWHPSLSDQRPAPSAWQIWVKPIRGTP